MGNSHGRDDHDVDPDSTPLQRAIDARRRGQARSDDDLTSDEQQLVDDILPWLDALQETDGKQSNSDPAPTTNAPVRHDDPVALMLGLIPEPDVVLNGRKLAAARKQARLNLGQLINRLRDRGWEVTIRQGLQWENGYPRLAPALITAIAEELSVSDDALLTTPPTRHGHDDLFDDQRIQRFIADWAAEAGVEPDHLREHASTTLAAAAHRNRTDGSVEALLDVLRTLRSIPHFLDNV